MSFGLACRKIYLIQLQEDKNSRIRFHIVIATVFLLSARAILPWCNLSQVTPVIFVRTRKQKETINSECLKTALQPKIADTMIASSAQARHMPPRQTSGIPGPTASLKTSRTQKGNAFPVPGIEPGSFRCFKSEDVKAEYPSLWTIREMVLLMKISRKTYNILSLT
jgi:hypothetical protein